MNPSFNLLDEPWMPVRLQGGSVQNMGLLEVFARSSEITALAETAPPSLVAQYRLLLAITHRALTHGLGRWTDVDRTHWYQEGLPLDVIHRYLEHWRERFWLFHSQYPFMQVAVLTEAEETKEKRKPWTQISLAAASGNTPAMFDHAIDADPVSICPAEAVGTLLGFLQFASPGLVQVLKTADKEGALANTAAVIPIGETLAQTLSLCLHPASPNTNIPDLAAWEREALSIADLRGEAVVATGPNDRYTRQSRAIQFCQEADGTIRWIRFAVGLALADDENAPDLMASFCERNGKLIRLSFREGRALWRDLPALTPSGKGRPATVLDNAVNLHSSISFDEIFQPVLVAGVASKKGKPAVLERWRVERISLHPALLNDSEKAQFLSAKIEKSESFFKDLRKLATSMLADIFPDPFSKETSKRAGGVVNTGSLATSYFAGAERELPQFMELIVNGEFDRADKYWNGVLRASAQNAWRQVNRAMGQSGRALRAMARYEGRLHTLLNKQVPKDKEPTEMEA